MVADVLWFDQLTRLQQVSATLLDTVPVLEDRTESSVGVLFPISVLPQLNTTIGSKTEQVPASPVQTVPTLAAQYRVYRGSYSSHAVRAWSGYLPSGLEGVVGLKASLTSWLAGASWTVDGRLTRNLGAALTLGAQYTSSELKGAITAADANDLFQSRTTLPFASVGVRLPGALSLSELVGWRLNASHFEIPSDASAFDSNDNQPVFQTTVGWSGWGATVALSELWVPERVLMPRLTIGYGVRWR